MKEDMVNHPGHYSLDQFECIDVMVATQGVEAVKNFCICNAFKYLYRHERKNGMEDVKKAQWYLNKYLELSGSAEKKKELYILMSSGEGLNAQYFDSEYAANKEMLREISNVTNLSEEEIREHKGSDSRNLQYAPARATAYNETTDIHYEWSVEKIL